MDGINDADDYKGTKRAMGFCGIDGPDQDRVFDIAAGILHLGNATFKGTGDSSQVENKNAVG